MSSVQVSSLTDPDDYWGLQYTIGDVTGFIVNEAYEGTAQEKFEFDMECLNRRLPALTWIEYDDSLLPFVERMKGISE